MVWGTQNIVWGARYLFLLYVLITNFLGTTKFVGAQKKFVRVLPPNAPPVATGLEHEHLHANGQMKQMFRYLHDVGTLLASTLLFW